ncbi:Endoglucanase EG-II [Arthrobotrys megalospora]
MHLKSTLAAASLVGAAAAQQQVWGQCGGIGYTGPTTCAAGSYCSVLNPYYSQCLPGGTTTTPSTTASRTTTRSTTLSTTTIRTTTPQSTTRISTTTTTKSTTASTTAATAISCSSNTPAAGAGSVKYAGINIAGFDFGCTTDGTCNGRVSAPPTQQFQHFRSDGFNTFRVPIGWQSLTPTLGGSLSGLIGQYDSTLQQCLQSGAYCIIDIHNYARWNGGIVGQGGPTDDQLVSLWTQLAQKYANQQKVWFGIMNEPHDVNIQTWGATVQKVVTAIRNAGATSQNILLPGNNYASAGAFISSGSADALIQVKNPDGSTTGLIFDVHKYLDSDNSGTHVECVTDNIDSAFRPLSYWLRCKGRQAILSETGGGNVQSCVTYMNQQLAFLNQNSDVYLGYIGWGAGSFGPTYELTETPNSDGSDTLLVKQALIPQFHP